MPANRIDAVLTPAQRTAVLDAVQTIRTHLPFLIGLTKPERKRLSKLGPDSRSFVETTIDLARNNPDILPGAFSLDNFQRDLDLYDALEEPYLAVQGLFEEMRDTRTQAGSEAWQSARSVYTYAKGTDVGGRLDDALDQLGLRFRRD